MYGAILGDIIGSSFEFDRGDKTKNFELFTRGCGFTDDSVMTVAVAEALIAVGSDADEKEIEDAVATNMQDWGRRYPNAGYGGKFWHWLRDNKPKPYGSYGNGSAMRVSAAGWLYPTIERTRETARCTAAVTHNHPEGIKGAEATASCIFLARSGASKEEIRNYVEQQFHYDLRRTLDEIRPYYHHVESCQQTVPEAITAFLEAKDFEDAVRNAVSLGGDTDTLAAITGSIAEAFFGIPAVLKAECRNRIDPEMNRVLDAFDEVLGRNNLEVDESLSGNDLIENAISNLYENQNHESFIDVISVTYKLKLSGGDIKAVQGDSGHAQADMVTEVYGHIIDEDRRKNAEMMENAFYNKENLNPQMKEGKGDSKKIEVPDGVDAELLMKVLANPEMAALLNSLAKTMK